MRDKLSRDERIRLECLSIVTSMPSVSNTANQIIDRADLLEQYIKYGKE